MTKSLTLVLAIILLGGCASTNKIDPSIPLAMGFAGPYPAAETSSDLDEAAYAHMISTAACADPIKPVSGRSRCH